MGGFSTAYGELFPVHRSLNFSGRWAGETRSARGGFKLLVKSDLLTIQYASE